MGDVILQKWATALHPNTMLSNFRRAFIFCGEAGDGEAVVAVSAVGFWVNLLVQLAVFVYYLSVGVSFSGAGYWAIIWNALIPLVVLLCIVIMVGWNTKVVALLWLCFVCAWASYSTWMVISFLLLLGSSSFFWILSIIYSIYTYLSFSMCYYSLLWLRTFDNQSAPDNTEYQQAPV